MEKITCDTILKTLQEWVENKQVVSPHIWVDAALKLSVLIGEETDRLYDLQQKVAQMKSSRIENGQPATRAKVFVETTEEYKESKKQEAKINRIFETIRLSKLRARLLDSEVKSY